jgi:hypothetical protein
MILLSSLPFELLTQVFFHVDQTTLTGTCVLVSKLWKSTIEDIGTVTHNNNTFKLFTQASQKLLF